MFSVADDSGCVADPAGFTEQAQAVVYDVPDANAGRDDEICSNTYTLKAEKRITGSDGIWSATGATFTDPADPQSSCYQQISTEVYCLHGPKPTGIARMRTRWRLFFMNNPRHLMQDPISYLISSILRSSRQLHHLVGSGKWTVVSGTGNFSNDTLAGCHY